MRGVEGRDKQNQRIPPIFFLKKKKKEQHSSRVSASPTNLKTPRFRYSRLSKYRKNVEDGQVLALRDEAGESGWR